MSYPTWGADKFNLPRGARSTANDSGLHALTAPAPEDANGRLLHPNNPLLAFGVLAAIAFGLMAVSTSVRVGKTTASIQVGDTK